MYGGESFDADWPMMAIGNGGYGNGVMGSVYDVSFVEDYPVEDLSKGEVDALMVAVSEEYLARAMYRKVLKQFGENMPFSHIVLAEETHIGLLKSLFEKYDLDVPGDSWDGTFGEFVDFYDACDNAADAEIRNIDVYTGLLEDIDNADISEVFSLLQWGSSMHLRAFQMCSYGEMGQRQGTTTSYGRGLGYGMSRSMGPGVMRNRYS